jgi:hypothetical protein
MRDHRVIIALIFLFGCKASTVVQQSTAPYYEDLSVHRPSETMTPDVPSINENVSIEEPVIIEGHIREELDSINRIITSLNENKLWDGYVIQLYGGNSRQEANNVINEFSAQFPEFNTSMIYQQPRYRVKAGRFFDRMEAHKAFETVKKSFPKAILLPEKLPLKDE